MPYLPSEARKKSSYYEKLLDADVIEQINLVKELQLKSQVSSSIDATNPTRDDDGVVVSIEDPFNLGRASEGISESVRIENKQQFFNDRYINQVAKPFSFFTTPNNLVGEDVQIEDEENAIKDIEAETADPTSTSTTNQFRDLLVRFFQNVKINDNVEPISDEKLQSEMAAFLKKGPKRNLLKSIQSRILAKFFIKNKQYESYIKINIFSNSFGNVFAKGRWNKLGLPTSVDGLDFTKLSRVEENLMTQRFKGRETGASTFEAAFSERDY